MASRSRIFVIEDWWHLHHQLAAGYLWSRPLGTARYLWSEVTCDLYWMEVVLCVLGLVCLTLFSSSSFSSLFSFFFMFSVFSCSSLSFCVLLILISPYFLSFSSFIISSGGVDQDKVLCNYVYLTLVIWGGPVLTSTFVMYTSWFRRAHDSGGLMIAGQLDSSHKYAAVARGPGPTRVTNMLLWLG